MLHFLKGSRYTTIIVSIALFLVFDLGVLVLNFYISAEIKDDAIAVNLAGRQRMLSQRTVKSLLQLQSDLQTNHSHERSLTELRKTITLFDTTLAAFRNGGRVTGAGGQPVQLAAASTDKGREVVAAASLKWSPYLRLIEDAIGTDIGSKVKRPPNPANHFVEPDSLARAIDYGIKNNLTLLKLMNDLTNELEGVAGSKADRLRMIQAIGISLALINFGIILFHFIGNLRDSDRRAKDFADDLQRTSEELIVAKGQTDEILETVGEGLFLLDEDGRIGNQYSAEMSTLFPGPEPAGQSLLELLGPRIDGKTWGMTRDFLALLFQTRLKEKMLINVNPLDQVSVQSDGNATRTLSFSFNRVVVEGQIRHILVTVRDITDRVRLAQELEQSRAKAKEQIELMFGILHVEPVALQEFLDQSRSRLDVINGLLRDSESQSGHQSGQLKHLIDPIFREIHSLKGDAAILGLALFEDTAHEFEDDLTPLRDKTKLEGPDFVPLTLKLDELRRHHRDTLALVERVAGLNRSFSGDPADSNLAGQHALVNALHRLVADLSRELDKAAVLDTRNFDPNRIPATAYQEISDILVQLVRNAMAHGIETPDQRLARNKSDQGQITLSLVGDADQLTLSVRDDGQGLALDKIRQRAAERGLRSAEQLAAMDKRQVAAMIFEPGFSTADKTSKAAGRGVGMDIVRDQVKRLQGKLKLSYAPEQFMEMNIMLPLKTIKEPQS